MFQPITLSILLLSSLLACAFLPPPSHQSVKFDTPPQPHGENQFPNWQYPPQELENRQWLSLVTKGEFETPGLKRTEAGTSGATATTLYFPGFDKEIRLKWKEMKSVSLDGFNNSPRKQIAAYEIQKLFLEPEDYVVPYVYADCVPLDIYNRYQAKPRKPSLPGTNCRLGLASQWLVDVKVPEKLYDESRFLEDPTYAYYMSNLNILTYLVDHRDTKASNFLVSKDENRRLVFSIDNDIAFGTFPYNFFWFHWNKIRVAALRRDSIDRLRRLERQDLDFLEVLEQLEKNDDGILRPVPVGDKLCPDGGVCIKDGTVQFGLTKSEIDDVWKRIQALIAKVDSGKIPVF
jgi:hypothetical protein